ncbi:hypothetical protein RCOM_0740960 [Ricinus communis]|uniref:Uncharacterized protein n=1 Tax=Ricinus communis TaxID=3988 RepID=B9SHM8_RICCO|nr:hypothetical protein RCOM_0740960 [Ricinus communis]
MIGRYNYGIGSRIIITSKDKQVLKNVVDDIYEVEGLNDDEALQLFSLNAFKDICHAKEIMELADRAVKYAHSNPLALKVLGQQVTFMKRVLDGCGFSASIGIDVLANKFLITIQENKLEMHDLFQEMAHEIVPQESVRELGKRSRLWSYDNVYQVLTKNLSLVSLKEINLSNSEHLTTFPDLSHAKNLERMNFEYCTSLVEVPSSVRFLDKLIDWNMRYYTSLLSFLGGIKLRSLKTLNLFGYSNFREYPEIVENITYLNLNETAIEELPRSISNLNGLIALNLKDYRRLKNLLESICLLKSLVTIDLFGCSNITRFLDISGDIRYLYSSETIIEEIPSSIGLFSRLSFLDLMNCKRLKNLPSEVSKLASLRKLVLSGCSGITKFPEV